MEYYGDQKEITRGVEELIAALGIVKKRLSMVHHSDVDDGETNIDTTMLAVVN